MLTLEGVQQPGCQHYRCPVGGVQPGDPRHNEIAPVAHPADGEEDDVTTDHKKQIDARDAELETILGFRSQHGKMEQHD